MMTASRIVVVSGLSLTGTTTFARMLATTLAWDVVLVGDRFRDYAREHRLSLTAIPLSAHRDFDNLVQQELAGHRSLVLDGRYLGFFARTYSDVLRIRLVADLPTRVARAVRRAAGAMTEDQARQTLLARDSAEYEAFRNLYGSDDFLADKFFNLMLVNNDGTSLAQLAASTLSLV
jgi:cytidylate kinase